MLRQTYASGAEYRGEFKVGQFDGVGTYVYPDDSEYRGHWKQGKREGFGRMEMPSGSDSLPSRTPPLRCLRAGVTCGPGR
jgi:hypothetical protein